MPLKHNLRRPLKKGDKIVATVEEITDGCVVVSMLHQNRKFCGALMDTTPRNGPYGIGDAWESETKMETRHSQQVSKRVKKTSFPQPLLTRKSYNLDVPQPPPRNIYKRIRRSRRKARLNILHPAKEGSTNNKGWNFPTQDVSCQRSGCQDGVQDMSASKSGMSVKRKAKGSLDVTSRTKRAKFNDDTPSASSDNESHLSYVHEELASPIKHLIPRKTPTTATDYKIQKSPVIKITYKSPGGRGRMIKIPSKIHHSPRKEDIAMGEVISSLTPKKSTNNLKSKSVKRRLLDAKQSKKDVKVTSQETLCNNKSQKRKYVRKNKKAINTDQTASVCAWDEENDVPLLMDSGTNETSESSGPTTKRQQTKAIIKQNKRDKSNTVKYAKKLSVKVNRVAEIKKNSSLKTPLLPDTESVVEVKQKSLKRTPKKQYGKQEQAKKVLNRARKSSVAAPFALPQHTKCTKDIFSPQLMVGSSSPEKNKHLRVILEPLEGRNGLNLSECSARDSFIYHSFGPEKTTTTSPSQTLTPDAKQSLKKPLSPQSHTIYVTTCKSFTGTVFTQGDVVWGKLRGYPWWPSRIVKLIVTKTDGEVLQQEAMVGWFRSPTTSIIPLNCVQSFQKHFKIRFEKKRKGLYQKAIKDAQNALKEISPEVRKLISQFETS